MKVLKFTASWCKPCQLLATRMITWNTEGINIESIDVDSDFETAMRYGIKSVPTIIVLDENNNVINRKTGVITESQFRDMVDVQ